MMASGGTLHLRVSQLAVVLALFGLAPQLAFAQELFASIAYSDKDRQYGWANNYPTREAAEKAATESCAKSGKSCRSVLWFRNACGALVTGPDGFGADWSDTETAAVNKSLKACRAKSAGCALTRAFCTGK